MKIAVVGGTGSFGRALVQRLVALGEDVAIGSRDADRAKDLAAVYGVRGGTNEEIVADADLVVMSTRSNAAVETASSLAAAMGETPVLSVGADLTFGDEGVTPGRLGRSLAEEIADVVQGPVVAGFQSLAAAHMATGDAPDEDVLVCGSDAEAKKLVLDLGARIVAGRAIDAGPLANARALEGLTSALLNVNKAYKVQAGIRLTGLPD